jgi:3-hydroxy-D-aspartate aldolase
LKEFEIRDLNKEDLDTPSLLVDLSIMEKNMKGMANFARECGVNLRPHAKTHKVPEIAKMQLEAGSTGVCLQKLSEAEVFASQGINDIFITNEVVGAQKIERLASLAKKIHLGVAVDNQNNLMEISKACSNQGSEIDLYVEVDVGMHRCGVATPEQAIALAEQVSKQKNVILKGLMGYEGHVAEGKTKEERLKICKEAMDIISATKRGMKDRGLSVDVVSVGSSVSSWINAKNPDVTEIQPGMYLFNDVGLVEKEVATYDDCALTVLSTVMSKPRDTHAVVDAGSKAFNFDQKRFPKAKGHDEIEVVKFSEEHGWLELSKGNGVSFGDKLEFIPYHCCTCVNQHEEMIGLRGSKVEKTWRILARGRMT